jgi:hypothetical protein
MGRQMRQGLRRDLAVGCDGLVRHCTSLAQLPRPSPDGKDWMTTVDVPEREDGASASQTWLRIGGFSTAQGLKGVGD